MRNSYLPLLILLILVGCRDGELENKRNQVAEVKIGQQIWMAKNLSVKTENSWCFGNCDQTGRHYSWEGAQAAADEVTGWRLPTDQDWRKL